MSKNEGSIGKGFGWMVLISILLFWLPTIGPLLAGVVGGKKSGGLTNAIVAALIPAIAIGILAMIFSSFLAGLPVAGPIIVAVTGGAGFLIGIFSSAPLLIGAIIGAIL